MFVCCGTLKKRGKKPVCGFKNASVCTFKKRPLCVRSKRPCVYVQNVPVCTGTTRTCVSTCARGDVLQVHKGVIASSAYQNLPTYGYHVLQRFTKETLDLSHYQV